MANDPGTTAPERTWVTPHATSAWSDRAIDAAVAALAGRPVDRATIAAALNAADHARRAENAATAPGPQPRSVEVYIRWRGHPQRIPAPGDRDWTADPAELAEMVTRAQSMLDDPTTECDEWRIIVHGPGTPERAAHQRQILAGLETSARAARTAEDVHRAECDGTLTFAGDDDLADHILECGTCQAEERDHLDAEDDR